jgi:HK97 gp10 family phage protein
VIKMETHGFLDVTEGLRALQDELVALGANEGRRTLQRAARKAFAPVLAAALAKAPVDSGLTKDNLRIATQKPQGGDSVVLVGLKVAKSKEKRTSKHGKGKAPKQATSPHWRWHFIEGGTASQPARPFLRPALDANAEAVVADLRTQLRKEIDRVVRKRAKAAKKGAGK